MIAPINVTKSFYISDWPMMMLATLFFMAFIFFDRELSRGEGIVLFVLLLLFLIYLFRFQKQAVIDEPLKMTNSSHLVKHFDF